MAVDYSEGTSLTVGLSKTFDGKHPCKLCKAVAEGRQSEKKQESKLELKKLDLLSVMTSRPVFAPAPCNEFAPMDALVIHRLEPPLTPPPRSV